MALQNQHKLHQNAPVCTKMHPECHGDGSLDNHILPLVYYEQGKDVIVYAKGSAQKERKRLLPRHPAGHRQADPV